jgi:hypothetical protein
MTISIFEQKSNFSNKYIIEPEVLLQITTNGIMTRKGDTLLYIDEIDLKQSCILDANKMYLLIISKFEKPLKIKKITLQSTLQGHFTFRPGLIHKKSYFFLSGEEGEQIKITFKPGINKHCFLQFKKNN